MAEKITRLLLAFAAKRTKITAAFVAIKTPTKQTENKQLQYKNSGDIHVV
jgi:hypothetical protein